MKEQEIKNQEEHIIDLKNIITKLSECTYRATKKLFVEHATVVDKFKSKFEMMFKESDKDKIAIKKLTKDLNESKKVLKKTQSELKEGKLELKTYK